MRTLVNVLTAALVWLIAGRELFDQSYGWWEGVDSAEFPLHSGLIYIFLAPLVAGVLVFLADIYLILKRAANARTASYWLYPATIFAGLVAIGISGDLTRAMTVRALGPGERGQVLLFNGAGHGDIRTVNALLDSGMSPDSQGPGGDTALHAAAGNGRIDVMKLLIDRGANVTVVGSQGLTALHAAEGSKNPEAVRLLLAHGARKYQ